MGETRIASTVLGVLIAAFLVCIVIAHISTEERTKSKPEKERDRQDRQREPSHEQAKDREWWI
jgi:hypothetical protein